MQITDISEAKATLSNLIEKVLKGEEVIIGKASKPIAKLVPYNLETVPRHSTIISSLFLIAQSISALYLALASVAEMVRVMFHTQCTSIYDVYEKCTI